MAGADGGLEGLDLRRRDMDADSAGEFHFDAKSAGHLEANEGGFPRPVRRRARVGGRLRRQPAAARRAAAYRAAPTESFSPVADGRGGNAVPGGELGDALAAPFEPSQ